MLKIKEKPEDFFVQELIDLDIKKSGKFCYFILKKRNYNTLDALSLIGKKIGVGLKSFGFCGNKDKRAVTEQYVSINCGWKKLESLGLKDINLEFAGYGDKRIKLGDNKGNFFRIKFVPKNDFKWFANYFGEQRFGIDLKNAEKGKMIVKKEFCDVNEMRKDKNLRMYFHAYQGWLWNKVLNKYLRKFDGYESDGYWFVKEKQKNFLIPLINFDTELKREIGEIYTEILNKENIKREDFLIRQFPELVSDTVHRNAFCYAKDFKINNGYVEFSLDSGSYATVFLRKLNKKV